MFDISPGTAARENFNIKLSSNFEERDIQNYYSFLELLEPLNNITYSLKPESIIAYTRGMLIVRKISPWK